MPLLALTMILDSVDETYNNNPRFIPEGSERESSLGARRVRVLLAEISAQNGRDSM